MIEVRKLIPQVYNQSRDFSVFMGLLQVLINEADINSLKLSKLPIESVLPSELINYENLRGEYRFLLKNKGSIECILRAISLSGGKTIYPLEEENSRISIESPGDPWDYEKEDREVNSYGELRGGVSKDNLVYYYRKISGSSPRFDIFELNINLEGQSQVDSGLLEKLLYYIKPVNIIIKLNYF